MGNSPSTAKPASQSSSQTPSQHDRPGTTAVQPPSSSASRPKPLHARPLGPGATSGFSTASSSTTAASSTTSAKLAEAAKHDEAFGPGHAPTQPVAVPNPHHPPPSPTSPRSLLPDDIYGSGTMPHGSLQDVTYLTRPPRLPLPIEEEVHTPGSPIIAAADASQPIDDIEGLDAAGLTNPSSNLSDTSILEEDDTEELLVDKTRPTVPTRLEWRHGGDKIYLTGTIFQWNRKTRLHPVDGQPGVFATTINILPGTHHIRFLVDGQMQTSPEYPTTVDFGNNLVNYIEVNPDDLQPPSAETDGTSETKSPAQQQAQATNAASTEEQEATPVPRDRDVPPASLFEHKIPRYLLDLDQPEDSPVYHTAVLATEKLPNPPALPGFLSKPILNAATPRKDDNSVLSQPNHTVLNHLATSSIKNNVLAVSATTRYKSKYVTTIMYKPTTMEGI